MVRQFVCHGFAINLLIIVPQVLKQSNKRSAAVLTYDYLSRRRSKKQIQFLILIAFGCITVNAPVNSFL